MQNYQQGKHSSQIVINDWNNLPQEVIDAASVTYIQESRLGKYRKVCASTAEKYLAHQYTSASASTGWSIKSKSLTFMHLYLHQMVTDFTIHSLCIANQRWTWKTNCWRSQHILNASWNYRPIVGFGVPNVTLLPAYSRTDYISQGSAFSLWWDLQRPMIDEIYRRVCRRKNCENR